MKIAIMGIGNMGSWLAKELSKENEVAVFDLEHEKCSRINNAKVLSKVEEFSAFAPELAINAVTLQHTVKAFEELVKHISNGCVLVDVTSVKTGIPEFYKKSGFRFVSMHPMFGPTFANVEALENESLVIIKESDEQMAEFFRKFFKGLGLNLFEYTFKEHDEMMAYSLTLPFASTMVFAACLDKKSVPGTTFKKHMKIAKGLLSEDDHLLAEILFNPNSMKQLVNVTNRLEFLKHVIKGRDFEEAKKFFDKLRESIR